MVEKRDVIRYALLGAIVIVLISILMVLRGGPTGYAVYEDDEETEFDLGSYSNVEWNGSAIVLSSGQVSGIYTSQIFDAGYEASWDNISWSENKPNLEFLFAVDGVADVWNSMDGIIWGLIKDDYTGADGNGATYMIKNSSEDLFILYDQDLWQSTDSGVTWIKVNDDINPGAGNNGQVMTIDSGDYIYIIDGADKVLKSTDSGFSFNSVNDDFGEGPNAGAMIADNDNDLFIIDNSANVFQSIDSGVTWIKINDDYNAGAGNDVNDMFANSSGDLFAVHGQDLWQSTDSGVTWIKINEDYNGGDTGNAQVIYIDSNNYIYIVDGSEDIYQSIDSGISFSRLVENINGGNGNIFGLTSIMEPTSLDIQVKSCDDDACSGESFVDITDTSPKDLSVDNNQYFQYKVDFTSPDSSISPGLKSVNAGYTVLNTPPTINLANPQGGDTYGYDSSIALDFTASDSEDNIDSCWYNLDNGVNVSLAGCANTAFDVVGDGSYVLNIYVNDTNSEQATDSASFSVTVGAPTIVLDSPINVYLNNEENIEFDYTPTDVDLDYCELWGNFTGVWSLNQTDASPTSGSVNTFNLNLGDGEYLWNIQCVDDMSNSAFNGNKTFYVDIITPSLSLTEPTGSKTSRTVSATWTTSDASPISCKYNVYQGASLEVINTSVVCDDNSVSFDVSSDADFVFNFYVNDSAGNSDNSNLSFSVDTSSVVVPPSGGGDSGGGSSGGGGVYIPSNTSGLGKLQVSVLGDVIAQEAEKKTLSVNAKNIGVIFVNNCRLSVIGDVSSWIYSTQVEGIAPGENIDFIFDLNVPEEIEPGDYSGDLEIKCDEGNDIQNIEISISGLSEIRIKEITQEDNLVKINYTFDNSFVIGESASVEIWIEDSEGYEIERIQDVFDINRDGLIERNVEIKFEGEGIYYIYFALSNDLESFVKESIVLGGSQTTGFAILDTLRGKTIAYVSFVVILAIAIFLIWKSHGKKDKSNPHHKKTKHNKHNWLVRKSKKKVKKNKKDK